jgi:acylphosphatase
VTPQQRLVARVVGRVQAVGFRWWTLRQATALGLTGWVMNGADERTVELVAEGAPDALDELERRLHQGPSGARVEALEATRGPASGEFGRFEITRQ